MPTHVPFWPGMPVEPARFEFVAWLGAWCVITKPHNRRGYTGMISRGDEYVYSEDGSAPNLAHRTFPG